MVISRRMAVSSSRSQTVNLALQPTRRSAGHRIMKQPSPSMMPEASERTRDRQFATLARAQDHACREERCAPPPEHPLYGVGRRKLSRDTPRDPRPGMSEGTVFSGPALERYDDEFGCPPSLPRGRTPSSARPYSTTRHLLDRGRVGSRLGEPQRASIPHTWAGEMFELHR